MKSLQEYINESESKTDLSTNKVQPKNKDELSDIITNAFKNKQYDLNFIDTSEITDMSWLFDNVKHNFDISYWDVSNVTNMEFMFYFCNNFDCDLSNWDVSNVTNMRHTFYKCNMFTGKGLENWDVSKVEDMSYMFAGCEKFNCDLSDWDISNITRWKNMFDGCYNMTIPNWYK